MDIVLIPGALATPKLWFQQEKIFKKPIHYVDTLNSNSIVQMAERFCSVAPKQFTLIGFSMGGCIALELFRLMPERIEKLVLINSGARHISEKGQLERERSLDLIQKGKFEFLIKLIFKNSIYDTSKHKSLLPLVEEMAFAVGAENYTNQLNAILAKPDHSELLQDIKCPTLLIASQQDNVMPIERSEHMAQHIENSKLIYMEQCGHMAMLEKPNLLNQILKDWL
ncbi:alpha/beta fold hydrolase [Legionella sp. WA2024007413]